MSKRNKRTDIMANVKLAPLTENILAQMGQEGASIRERLTVFYGMSQFKTVTKIIDFSNYLTYCTHRRKIRFLIFQNGGRYVGENPLGSDGDIYTINHSRDYSKYPKTFGIKTLG